MHTWVGGLPGALVGDGVTLAQSLCPLGSLGAIQLRQLRQRILLGLVLLLQFPVPLRLGRHLVVR